MCDQEVHPVKIWSPANNTYVVDFGLNIAGRVRLTIPPESQVGVSHVSSCCPPTTRVGTARYVRSAHSKLPPASTLTSQGEAGTNVSVRHAEVLQHRGIVAAPLEGMIYVDNLRSARATDTYIFGACVRAHWS
jgi:hypothetical protein